MISTHRIGTVLLAFFLVTSLCTTVFAQEKEKSIEQLNEEGITAFQEGRFAEAAERFHQAYELQPAATLKKNEAIAWFKSGNCEKAVTAADAFLMEAPEDPTSVKEARAVVVKCKVETAKQALADGELDKAATKLEEARTLQPEEEVLAQIESLSTSVEQKRAEQAKAEAERQRRERERREAASAGGMNQILGWGLTGGGSAIVLGAFIYHMVVLFSVHPEFEDIGEAGVDRARFNELGDQLDTAQWLIPTLYGVGLATAGVGVYFLVSDTGTETAPPTATRAGTTEGSGRRVTVGIRGTF